MSEKKFISASQAAEMLGLSKGMIYKLANSGKLSCVRYEGRILFRKEDVEAYFRNHYQKAEGEKMTEQSRQGQSPIQRLLQLHRKLLERDARIFRNQFIVTLEPSIKQLQSEIDNLSKEERG